MWHRANRAAQEAVAPSAPTCPACSKCEACPLCQQHSSPATAERQALEVKPSCWVARIDAGRVELRVHAVFSIDSKFETNGLVEKRRLVHLGCNLTSGQCKGAQLELGVVDSKKPLSEFAFFAMEDVTVQSQSSDVYVIKWGLFRTYTLDLRAGEVTYVSRTPEGDRRSVAPCPDGR